jgi:type VI protein secretion system component Hcp
VGGVGRAAGKPRDFIATRRTDASSPDLQQAAAKGTSFKSATIIVRTRGPQSVERMRIELSEGYVLGYQFHGGGDPTRRWETVSLSANDIKIVLPEPPVHGPMPAPVPVPYPNTPPK